MTEDQTPHPAPAPGPPARGDTEAAAAHDGDDAGIAPRPRPGWKSRPASPASIDAFQKASLFAGVLRAALGAAGLFASLLYLPIHTATPILAGVSILMMVTGSTSAWRAVRQAPPAYRKIPLYLAGGCAVATAASVVLTLVFGAGTFGPIAAAREEARAEASASAPPTVRFEPAP